MAVCPSVDPDGWREAFEGLAGRLDRRFARPESRRRMRRFLRGLMAGLPRVNCWTLAEHAGEASPGGMQHFLATAMWDDDGLRADLRDYVVERFGDSEAVFVFDETGDVKKGSRTVGVPARWATGGRVGPERGAGVFPGPFPWPALRTTHAAFTARRSPVTIA